MGNCTSKKSGKALKLNLSKKPPLNKKMEKESEPTSKGLSKKVVPFTKGEATSFGFKKRPTSSLPIPVTLTSNGNTFQGSEEKKIHNGILKNKELIDDYQSGSSVESLCHAPLRSTPKMIRKRDLVRQNINCTTGNNNSSNNNNNNNNQISSTVSNNNHNNSNNNQSINNNNNYNSNNNASQQPNRFGFRQQTPPRAPTEGVVKSVKYSTNTHVAGSYALSNQGPYDTGTFKVTKKSDTAAARSRSEGPREAFFRQNLQPASSMQSVLNQPRATFTSIPQPGKFTLQTSHLPRPQFPVRMADTKTAKTVTNYYRRGGAQSDSNSSKEGSLNDDSGFESHPSANSTLRTKVETLDSSPGYGVRRRLPAHGRKLEMKIVGNKFELLKKEEEADPSVVTEVSLIKLPTSGIRTSTAIINTGLVEQRTNQYLKKISQNNNGLKDSNRLRPKSIVNDTSSESSHNDEGIGGESEEEKLFKDSKKSEKSSGTGLLSDGSVETDEMMPGEAMAEDISLSLSSDDDTSAEVVKRAPARRPMDLQHDVTPNSIRLDALKLSKQLKFKNSSSGIDTLSIQLKTEDSSFGLLTPCEPDEVTFPSDSILEQLSSDSDSLGDKGENKNNDKEKNLKNVDIDPDTEAALDIDIDIGDLELDVDVDEKELEDIPDIPNNTIEPQTPESPGTPTNASNSLSLSEGRDFLIDDEIADQPQLCLTETYPDCSCHEDVKTCNDKTLTSSGNNNEFVSCSEVTNTMLNDEGAQPAKNVEAGPMETENVINTPSPARKDVGTNSVGTLSPCESLTSDDLMLDFETSVCDENNDRMDSVNDNISVDDVEVSANGDEILKEWSSVSSQKNNAGMGSGKLLRSRGGSGSSTPGSPRSVDVASRGVASPLRSSRASTTDEDSVRVDKLSYQHMFQDIVSIKTMLLKLKRVLSESEGGLYENGIRLYSEDGSVENGTTDEMTDLRRQVVFLQQQLEEREKMVQNLQLEINKTQLDCSKGISATESREQCNAATQTDRVRPVSTGPSILQNLPSDSGSIVSNSLNNSRRPDIARGKNEIAHDERNTKGFVSVKATHVDKIMEKVKELSFKPVEVLEKEESQKVYKSGCQSLPRCKYNIKNTNGLYSTNTIVKQCDVRKTEPCKKSQNVFKITKIDLVLKSDNYGKSDMTKSNR